MNMKVDFKLCSSLQLCAKIKYGDASQDYNDWQSPPKPMDKGIIIWNDNTQKQHFFEKKNYQSAGLTK